MPTCNCQVIRLFDVWVWHTFTWQAVQSQIRSQLIWIYTIWKGGTYPGSAGPGLIVIRKESVLKYWCKFNYSSDSLLSNAYLIFNTILADSAEGELIIRFYLEIRFLTFHTNCFLRISAWNVKSYFLADKKKKNVSKCRRLNYFPAC